jgi:hypothetical protein
MNHYLLDHQTMLDLHGILCVYCEDNPKSLPARAALSKVTHLLRSAPFSVTVAPTTDLPPVKVPFPSPDEWPVSVPFFEII